MTIAHQEQISLRERCDAIGRYLSAVITDTAASNGVREATQTRANSTA